MAGGPVRLPLDDLDDKKTEQLRKILATIPNKAKKSTADVPKKPIKKATVKTTTQKKRIR